MSAVQLSDAPKLACPQWCQGVTDPPLLSLTGAGANLRLAALLFEENGFHPDDFAYWGITPPTALYRAARKRQAEFLAGRLCAGEALRKHHGVTRFPPRDDDGAPVWPQRTSGSITHSAGLAMAVVGDSTRFQGMGLDIEVVQNQTEARSLTSLVLTPDEQDRYREALTHEPGLCLTRIFSLKEALFKALYPLTRQRFYFQDAEVTALESDGQCRLRLLTQLAAAWPRGREVQAHLTTWQERVVALVLTSPIDDSNPPA